MMHLARGQSRGAVLVFIGFVLTVSVLDLFLLTRFGFEETTSKESILKRSLQSLGQLPKPKQNLEVVMTFPHMLHPNWNASGYEHLSRSQKETRMDEYLASLNRTIMHSRVKVVHLLYDQESFPEYISARFVKNILAFKILFHYLENTRQAISSFKFAFEKLKDHLVMVSQADVYPDSGFDLIDYQRFKSQRLMYALTRHGKLEKSCDMSGDFCDDGRPFVGSHDSYVFVPTEPLSKSAVNLLSTDTMAWGVDLVITWVFQKELKYKVLNPCKVIIIYHIHCSSIRNVNRPRVNTANTTGWFPPSSVLY